MKRIQALGQHQLIDHELLEKMVELAEIEKSDVVFEIGAGRGTLTEKLSLKAERVVAYELDEALYKEALQRLSGRANVEVRLGDAFDSSEKFDALVSNLPYSQSRRFIEWIAQRRFRCAVVMLQDEFVSKLFAKAGEAKYRAVSIIAQYSFNMNKVAQVEASSFYPPPKVASAIIMLKPKRSRRLEKIQMVLVKKLFSNRGKKVSTAVKVLTKGKGQKYVQLINSLDDRMLAKRVEYLTHKEAVQIVMDIA